MVDSMDNSVLAYVGSAINFIFTPLGFGTWQATVATLLGLLAKEEIVGVFGVLYSNLAEAFTAAEGYSFLIFNLLCAPCVAAMGAIRREMNNSKWTAFAIGYQCFFAYCVSLVVYRLTLLIIQGEFNVFTVAAFAVIALFAFMLAKKPYQAKDLKNKREKEKV